MQKKLSILVPIYNEEYSLQASIRNMITYVNDVNLDTKIILINDGSRDNSWRIMENLVNENSNIEAINLSKNFGKDCAILAGLSEIESDFYLVIDSDGEHPFDRIGDLVHELLGGKYDIVHGVKKNRRGSSRYKFLAKKYNRTFNLITGMNIDESSDFKIFNSKVKNAIISYGDTDYFFRGVAQDVGFRSSKVYFSENKRAEGTSSWGNKKLLAYALNSIISFSHLPLYIILCFGSLSFIVSSFIGVKWLLQYSMYNNIPEGYSTIILLLSLSFGLIMISLGIIGLYVSKIFDLSKKRPRYLVSEIIKMKLTCDKK